MIQAMLVHNTGAGDEEHRQEDLMELLAASGIQCRYSSTKEKWWKHFEFEADILVIAGGDGTVRKVTKALLNRKMIAKTWPIGLLPLGTANNIAKTLGLEKAPEDIIPAWQLHHFKRYDVGCVYHRNEASFFLESLGYGIFPYLMQEMKKRNKDDNETPEEKIKAALVLLHQLLYTYAPRRCQLLVDGVDYSGTYLLAEIMNTQSIGPNLLLAPEADPGDGKLEVIVVPEADKDSFAQYVFNKMNGKEEPYAFSRIQGEKITISWDGTHIHIDDEVLNLQKNEEINIELKKGLLEFLMV